MWTKFVGCLLPSGGSYPCLALVRLSKWSIELGELSGSSSGAIVRRILRRTRAGISRFFAIICCTSLVLGFSSIHTSSDNDLISRDRYALAFENPGAPPRNIIVMIGDGMGPAQVAAAGLYLYGEAGTLSFESAPYVAEMTTFSASSSITDSAASATAMATGHKVNNYVLSMAYPGDGGELETLLEFFRDRCKSTGLVTTTRATDATPAAFGSHESSRSNLSQIAVDYFNQTQPDIILGGGGNGMSVSRAEGAGYTVLVDRKELNAVGPTKGTYVSGQFGEGNMAFEYDYEQGDSNFYDTYPHLSEMAQATLGVLENDPDGFFMMIEGGRIDHAGHANLLERNVFETIEFANAVRVVLDWAEGRNDTLIIVTSDHETGGLSVIANNGEGNFPAVTWATTGHTDANVPAYAWGPNADMVVGVIDNTDIYDIATANSDGIGTCASHAAYADVPTDHWAFAYIEALHDKGFVAGCQASPLKYCPERVLVRGESAVFVVRGDQGGGYQPPVHPGPDTFADVDPSYWGYHWIEDLYAKGFTAGCGLPTLSYCPLNQHTRAEGSVFFLRVKYGGGYQPPVHPGPDTFVDVPSTFWGYNWVEKAYADGLLPACETSPQMKYCPDGLLDRGWAAFMMVQAKGGLPLP